MLDLTSTRTPRRISRFLVVAISAALALVAVMATSGGAYADSVHGDSWIWSWAASVPAYSTISSSSMTTLLNQQGYVW